MITANTITHLLTEEYYLTKNLKGKEFILYKNPDRSEFQAMLAQSRRLGGDNTLRFVANGRTREMFACNAYQVRHVEIRSMVGLPPQYEATPYTIDGYLSANSTGKAEMFAWEDL